NDHLASPIEPLKPLRPRAKRNLPSMKHTSAREVIGYSSPEQRDTGFRLPGLRWWIIVLIMLGSVLNYLTRNTLSVAQVQLKDTLQISDQQYSWITIAFQIALILQPICGYMLDLLGLRIGFAIFAAAWSVTNMLHGLAGSWRGIAFLRGLMGFAEGSA